MFNQNCCLFWVWNDHFGECGSRNIAHLLLNIKNEISMIISIKDIAALYFMCKHNEGIHISDEYKLEMTISKAHLWPNSSVITCVSEKGMPEY